MTTTYIPDISGKWYGMFARTSPRHLSFRVVSAYAHIRATAPLTYIQTSVSAAARVSRSKAGMTMTKTTGLLRAIVYQVRVMVRRTNVTPAPSVPALVTLFVCLGEPG
jgi:hypothetical protein